MKKRVLVTGGAGFIGSHVVDELIKLNNEVFVIDDLSGGFIENINPKAIFIKGDITDKRLIDDFFEKNKPEIVYHLAAYAAEGLSPYILNFNYNNNLIGSINLINASIRNNVETFVFTSSIAVYGTNQLPMKEETIPLPEDPYGIAKYAVELQLIDAQKRFGLNYIIFRPHNVYGEKQNLGDKYRNVLGIFMNQIMLNKPITIFGDGEQTRAFTYIGDVAPIIAKSPFVPKAINQIFNIGADKAYTVNTLKDVIIQIMKKEHNVKYLPAREEVTHAYSSHKKVKEIFNYTPLFSLEEGIKKMAEWALKKGPMNPTKSPDIEIYKNFPKAWK